MGKSSGGSAPAAPDPVATSNAQAQAYITSAREASKLNNLNTYGPYGNVTFDKDANGVPIERVPYRVGVSTVTVEQLARQHACSGQGAGLITEPGPVEVYRLQCSDGKVFMARCELRQCRKM